MQLPLRVLPFLHCTKHFVNFALTNITENKDKITDKDKEKKNEPELQKEQEKSDNTNNFKHKPHKKNINITQNNMTGK
ncbi:hypothetical protein CVS40_8257 [Lucilia cuprina]|nr:hypothetical protein CVS40_8257 [Lucilia cuprina]